MLLGALGMRVQGLGVDGVEGSLTQKRFKGHVTCWGCLRALFTTCHTFVFVVLLTQT